MSQTNSARKQSSLSWIVAAMVIIAAASLWWWWRTRLPVGEYLQVINRLDDVQFVPDLHGRIDLSKTFPGVTPQDEMFITRRPDGSFLAFFPTFYAKGPVIAGWMYTSRPLQTTDTFSQGLAVDFNQQLIRVGPWGRLGIDKKADDHWYRVSYGLK